MEEQLVQIRDQFLTELLGLRQRLGGSWDALHTALKPTLDVLGSPLSTIVDHAHVSSSWEVETRLLSLTLIRRGAFALFRDDRGPDSHTARHGPRRFNAGVV